MSKLEIKRECLSCKGTGLYIGFAEHDGAAVVCRTCEGSGCETITVDNTPFIHKKERIGIKRVYRCNPGIGIGNGGGLTLEDFGGMPYKEWIQDFNFPPKSEMRKYTCPAWWYQTVDYKKKPNWDECNEGLGRSFSHCPYFATKEKCWERWDKEFSIK